MIARLGDIVVGTCITPVGPVPAIGIISSGGSALEQGLPIARLGDIVMFPCGSSIIMSGSISYLEQGLPVARLGDIVQGPGSGIISSASSQWLQL